MINKILEKFRLIVFFKNGKAVGDQLCMTSTIKQINKNIVTENYLLVNVQYQEFIE